MKEMNSGDNLRYATRVLFKHKVSIIVTLVFTLLCFVLGTLLITPQWEATAKLLVLKDPKQQMILFRDLEAPMMSDKGSHAADLVEILIGNELAKKIVTDFGLDERKRRKAQEPETVQEWGKYWLVQAMTSPITGLVKLGAIEEPTPNWFEKALDDLVEDMEDIELIEETSTIRISIWADDPDLAVDICDAMVDYLLEKTKDFDRSEAATTYRFVGEQLTTVEDALVQAEDEVLKFKTERNIVQLDAEKEMLLQKFDRLTSDVRTKEAKLAARNARLDELRAQLVGPAVAEVGNIRTTVLTRQDFREQDADPYHGLRNSMDEIQIEQGILTTTVELSELRGEYKTRKAELAKVKAELYAFNEKELMAQRLLRSATGLQDRYMNLRKKQLQLEVQKYTETSEFDIKVADRAFIPARAEKDWPNWPLNLAVGLLLGLVFSIGQAFFFEYWRDTLQDTHDVAESVDIEVLGSVGSVSLKKLGKQLNKGQ